MTATAILRGGTILIGGPLARACTWCKAPPGERCSRNVRGSKERAPCLAHAARSKDAPPHQVAGVGDLVLVRTGGTGRSQARRHVLALLVNVGQHGPHQVALVRLWQPHRSAFARPRLLAKRQIVQLADEITDARAGAARAFMDRMQPARDVEVLSKTHGRLRVVDAEAASVRWITTDGGVHGMTSLEEWRRGALAGDIRPVAGAGQLERTGSCSN